MGQIYNMISGGGGGSSVNTFGAVFAVITMYPSSNSITARLGYTIVTPTDTNTIQCTGTGGNNVYMKYWVFDELTAGSSFSIDWSGSGGQSQTYTLISTSQPGHVYTKFIDGNDDY